MDRIDKFIDGLEETFAHIRERECGDSVCGLCEYDGAYIGESGDWCNECPGFNKDDCFKLSDKTRKKWTEEILAICKHFRNDSEIPNSSDVISRRQAIDALDCINGVEEVLRSLPSAQPEHICLTCGRTANNGGWYEDGRTRCPIEEHYALPKDGHCHLWENQKVWEDDYPERREE